MNQVLSSNAVIPFPSLPRSLFGHTPAGDIGMRLFGKYESDLVIDFSTPNPAALITRILELCTIDPENSLPEDFFLKLSLSKRLECLLVLAAGEERLPFNFPFHCAGCGQELEMELTLDEIAEMQREADLIETVEVGISGRFLSFRKPSGQDQKRWTGRVFRNEKEAARAMIGSLAVAQDMAEHVGANEVDLVDEAMSEADPLVNFLCRVDCSECGVPNELLVDLSEVALGRLSRLQQQLIVMVHKLAAYYHWSEKEIFEVPYRRRKTYLDLILAGR